MNWKPTVTLWSKSVPTREHKTFFYILRSCVLYKEWQYKWRHQIPYHTMSWPSRKKNKTAALCLNWKFERCIDVIRLITHKNTLFNLFWSLSNFKNKEVLPSGQSYTTDSKFPPCSGPHCGCILMHFAISHADQRFTL